MKLYKNCLGFLVFFQETVHGLCRVVMSALENNTKLLVKYIQEGGEKREFGLALLNIVIVSNNGAYKTIILNTADVCLLGILICANVKIVRPLTMILSVLLKLSIVSWWDEYMI